MFDMRYIDEFRSKVHSEGELPTRRTTLILIDRIKELEGERVKLIEVLKTTSTLVEYLEREKEWSIFRVDAKKALEACSDIKIEEKG